MATNNTIQCALSALFARRANNTPGRFKAGGTIAGKRQQYVRVKPSRTSKSSGATFISQIFNVPGAQEFFSGLTDMELAQITPYMRLQLKDADNANIELPMTFIDREATAASKGASTFVTDTAAWNTSHLPRALTSVSKEADINILSVGIEDLTSRPEEEGSNIVVTIKFFLRNMNDLLKFFPGTTTIADPMVPGPTPQYGIPVSRLIQRVNTDIYEPTDNRIMLITGWSVPDGVRSEIKDALERSRLVLNLTLRDHTFSMADNGTVEMEVVYNAATDGFLTGEKARLVSLSDAEEKRVEEIEKEVEKLNNQIATHETALGGTESDRLTDLRDKLKEVLEEKTKIFRTGTQGFFTLFFDMLRPRVDLIVDARGELEELENQRIAGPGLSGYFDCYTVQNKLDKLTFSNDVGLISIGMPATGEEIAENIENAVKNLVEEGGEEEVDFVLDNSHAYVMFGDIVEALLETITINTQRRRGLSGAKKKQFYSNFPTLFLCPMDYFSNLCAGKKRGGSRPGETHTSGRRQKRVMRNVADMPIVFDQFLNSFVNKFARTGATDVSLKALFNFLVKDVLGRALGNGLSCWETSEAFNAHLPGMIFPFTYKPRKNAAGIALPPPDSLPRSLKRVEKTIDMGTLKKSVVYPKLFGPTSEGVEDGILFYVPDLGAIESRLGGTVSKRYKLNNDLGIQNVFLANKDGAILNYSFSKNNQPKLAEARVFGKGNIGGGDDISGGNLYNLTIDFVGNTFLRVGSLIFVETIGLGISRKLNNKLMIGGYYVVNKLTHNVSPDGFITTAECIYNHVNM
jgi:hypothetical protein